MRKSKSNHYKIGKMTKLKRLDIWSVAKFQAVYMAIFGLILGILGMIYLTIVGAILGNVSSIPMFFGIGFGVLGIIVLPILYGIFGFVSGAILAFLYNLVARWVGGIEMEFEN